LLTSLFFIIFPSLLPLGLLSTGPPVHLTDPHGFELADGEEYVKTLWYACDDKERSAVLKGAVEGEERLKLWEELKSFVVLEGKEEGDDDDAKSK
jgi:hypothetical protein